MKKFALSAAAIALATTSFTPAFAATIAFNSLPPAQQTLVQNTCNGFIPGMSHFIAVPSDLNDAVTVGFEVSRVTTESIPGGTLISQTPYVFTTGSEHRNGQSPNIFGFFTSVATYSGGKLVQQVTKADRHHVTFGCGIFKEPGILAPPGLQVPNNGILFVNYDTNVVTTTETKSEPNTTQTLTADQVICISPSTTSKGTKADGWRGQNGYPTARCTTIFYLSLGDNPGTHSNSVPNLVPLRPDTPDHNEPLALDSLFSSPLPWDGTDS